MVLIAAGCVQADPQTCGDLTSGAYTPVRHYTNGRWAEVSVVSAAPIAVSAQPQRVLFPGAHNGNVELLR